jgi:outer membrane receptor protein involved in Fe transport
MGGTIRYITGNPNLQQFSGSVEGEYGQVTDGAESYKAIGVLNAPLVQDKVGLRLVAGHERDGGWIDNTTTGEDDVNGVDFTVFRGKLLAQPTEALELSLFYQHENSELDNENTAFDRELDSTVNTFKRDRYDIANGSLQYDFGSVRLLETVSYLDRRSTFEHDLTPFFLPALEAPPPFGFGLPPGYITGVPFGGFSTFKILTNELRLASTGPDRFQWTAGAFYRDSDTALEQAASTFPGTLPFDMLRIVESQKSESYALFGEASYQLTTALNVLVGARYFRDHQEAKASSTNFGVTTPGGGDETFDTFNPRVNVRYQFSADAMVYFNAAKGFRSGGFNVSSDAPGVPVTYKPDSLWSYELGTKDLFFDRKLTVEASVYYNDWTDVQSLLVVPGTFIAVTQNGGKVSGWGTDLAASIRPMDGLTLTATYGWNNLKNDTRTSDKNVGDPVDFARPETYSASIDYRRNIFETLSGFIRADYQHAGTAEYTSRYSGSHADIPAFDLVGLRLGLDFGHVEATIFATNLLDEKTPALPATPGLFPWNIEQPPRTVGLNLKIDF